MLITGPVKFCHKSKEYDWCDICYSRRIPLLIDPFSDISYWRYNIPDKFLVQMHVFSKYNLPYKLKNVIIGFAIKTVDSTDLISPYVGRTEENANHLLAENLGGIIVINNPHSLYKEALIAIKSFLSQYDEIIVIFNLTEYERSQETFKMGFLWARYASINMVGPHALQF